MRGKKVFTAAMVLCLVFLGACGGGGGGSSGSAGSTGSAGSAGAVNMHITDAPAYGYNNVYITLEAIWFHTSNAAGPQDPGWLKFPITPVTIDLLTLANGNISSALWQNIQLPQGNYQQIRLFLAGTEDTLTASATSLGLTYNNEVVDASSNVAPLYIPDYTHGIRLAGTFMVSQTTPLNLAIDFNAGEDIVDVQRNGQTDYYLKPRLAYFDLNNAGAIVGTIDSTAAGNASTALFVFKAEQADASNQYYEMKRVTTWDATNNRFVLYPLAPGYYDVILRGVGYETVIIENVPVTQGTTPSSSPTVIPQVTMVTDTDVSVTASGLAPTGAWLNFYQTPQNETIPHEIRFRHLNPFTGGFTTGFALSQGPLLYGTYNASSINLNSAAPTEGLGGYKVVFNSLDYSPSAAFLLQPSSGSYASLTQTQLAALVPASPAVPYSIAGSVILPDGLIGQLDSGVILASHGGMITDAINAATQMASGGSYTILDLPGGFACAFYGVEGFGWSSSAPIAKKAISIPALADLRTGNATNVDLTMIPLF